MVFMILGSLMIAVGSAVIVNAARLGDLYVALQRWLYGSWLPLRFQREGLHRVSFGLILVLIGVGWLVFGVQR